MRPRVEKTFAPITGARGKSCDGLKPVSIGISLTERAFRVTTAPSGGAL